MCENSRQRVIQISSAVAVIFLEWQAAREVVGGEADADGGVAVWVSGPARPAGSGPRPGARFVQTGAPRPDQVPTRWREV